MAQAWRKVVTQFRHNCQWINNDYHRKEMPHLPKEERMRLDKEKKSGFSHYYKRLRSRETEQKVAGNDWGLKESNTRAIPRSNHWGRLEWDEYSDEQRLVRWILVWIERKIIARLNKEIRTKRSLHKRSADWNHSHSYWACVTIFKAKWRPNHRPSLVCHRNLFYRISTFH